MSDLRLVIFDVDGTLVDSEADIYAAMERAFLGIGATPSTRDEVRRIVGLSLDVAFARLSPDLDASDHRELVEGYKNAYAEMRVQKGAAEGSPLFDGARALIEGLRGDPWTLLAVATGKSQRGLDKLIEAHDLEGIFLSRQCADHHPSKPDPSMIHACIRETGATAARTVMIGDTTFDMDMARNAGVGSIGVSWGYHPTDSLKADAIAKTFHDIPHLIDSILEPAI